MFQAVIFVTLAARMTVAGGTIYKTELKMQTSTAKEAGWRLSGYNISTDAPEGEGKIIANLYTGSIAVYGTLEGLEGDGLALTVDGARRVLKRERIVKARLSLD